MAITTPPLTKNNLPFKISLLAITLATASATFAQTNLGTVTNENLTFDGDKPTLKINSPSVAESINVVDLETPITGSNFTIAITNSLTVNGDTHVSIDSDNSLGAYNGATHAFYLEGKDAEAHLNGNVEIVNTHADGIQSVFGANALYIQRGAKITLGTEGADTLTRIISIASIPDAISVKLGSTLTFNSTRNQVVGTIDLSSATNTEFKDIPSTVTGTFSGVDSFWIGDEASSKNTRDESRRNINPGILDLTFENGAQWSYLNLADTKAIPSHHTSKRRHYQSVRRRHPEIPHGYGALRSTERRKLYLGS